MNFETIIDYLRGLQNISEWTLETSHEEALETFFSGRRLDMARSKAVTRNSLTVHVDSRSREGFHRGSAIVSLPPNLELDELADRVATAMFLVCGFLGTLNLVPIFILFNLFFDGFADPARQAIQTDITTPGNRQGAFVLTYLGHNLGYSVGPVIAGFLFYKASRWLFFGNALMGFLSVLLNITLIPETKPTKEQLEESLRSDRTDKAVEGTLLMVMRKQTGLLVFGLLISLYGLAYGQTLFSLPLSAVAVFGEEQGAGVFGKLMSLNALLVIFLNAPVLSVTRRFRTLANVAFAGILYTAGFAGFFIARTLPFFYLCTLLWTLGEIVDAVNTWYYIANHTPMSHRGRFGGVFPFITGSGRAIAPYFGGQIIQRFGLGVLWLVTSAITTGGALGIRLLDRKRPENDRGTA